jgi:hypothetical protein
MTTSRLSFRPLFRNDRIKTNPPRVDKPVVEAVCEHIGYRNVASDDVRWSRTTMPFLVVRASLCSNARISENAKAHRVTGEHTEIMIHRHSKAQPKTCFGVEFAPSSARHSQRPNAAPFPVA